MTQKLPTKLNIEDFRTLSDDKKIFYLKTPELLMEMFVKFGELLDYLSAREGEKVDNWLTIENGTVDNHSHTETREKGCCPKCIKHPDSDLVCKGFCSCHKDRMGTCQRCQRMSDIVDFQACPFCNSTPQKENEWKKIGEEDCFEKWSLDEESYMQVHKGIISKTKETEREKFWEIVEKEKKSHEEYEDYEWETRDSESMPHTPDTQGERFQVEKRGSNEWINFTMLLDRMPIDTKQKNEIFEQAQTVIEAHVAHAKLHSDSSTLNDYKEGLAEKIKKMDVATYMRDFGIKDGDKMNAEDIQELCNDYQNNILSLISPTSKEKSTDTALHTTTKEYEEGFIEGQKHAFGVDRKAVRQEAIDSERERLREEIGEDEDETIENSEFYISPEKRLERKIRNQERRRLRSLISPTSNKEEK